MLGDMHSARSLLLAVPSPGAACVCVLSPSLVAPGLSLPPQGCMWHAAAHPPRCAVRSSLSDNHAACGAHTATMCWCTCAEGRLLDVAWWVMRPRPAWADKSPLAARWRVVGVNKGLDSASAAFVRRCGVLGDRHVSPLASRSFCWTCARQHTQRDDVGRASRVQHPRAPAVVVSLSPHSVSRACGDGGTRRVSESLCVPCVKAVGAFAPFLGRCVSRAHCCHLELHTKSCATQWFWGMLYATMKTERRLHLPQRSA